MILILSLTILFGVCLGWLAYDLVKGEDMPISAMISVIVGLFWVVVMIALFLNPYSVKGEIAQYEAVKTSIENARATDITDIERVALTQKIIETNKWLAQVQYDNQNLWAVFIPDEVDALEPLR